MSETTEAETIDVEKLEEDNKKLRGQLKRSKTTSFVLAVLSLSLFSGICLYAGYSSDSTRNAIQVSVVEWQTAYAKLVANNKKCGGNEAGQKILMDTVSNWPDFKAKEVAVIFADWQGEMRGSMIADYLRNGEKTKAEQVADARRYIEATHEGWSDD